MRPLLLILLCGCYSNAYWQQEEISSSLSKPLVRINYQTPTSFQGLGLSFVRSGSGSLSIYLSFPSPLPSQPELQLKIISPSERADFLLSFRQGGERLKLSDEAQAFLLELLKREEELLLTVEGRILRVCKQAVKELVYRDLAGMQP